MNERSGGMSEIQFCIVAHDGATSDWSAATSARGEKIQYAADSLWPARRPENVQARSDFKLPANRPFSY